MNLPSEPSSSSSSASVTAVNQWTQRFEKRVWRAIDYLHLIVMLFSLYAGLIVTILRNELSEQCPLYGVLLLRVNATQLTTDTFDRDSEWGSVHTCEFASFAYLSSFVVSFVSLWVHIVFRRVLRTERLLRLPIGITILIFALIDVVVTSVVTDGVIKFCSGSPGKICTASAAPVFHRLRWKIISLPVAGWLATLSIVLNVVARGVQLLSKPKKSPETLKALISQLAANRQQQKLDKDMSDYGSQISRGSRNNRSQSAYRPMDRVTNREFSSELYPYFYPAVPQYRQIEKRSRFQRIFCPCLRRRPQQRSYHEAYRPFVIPNEYYRRLDYLKQNGTVPVNSCNHHHHSTHYPVEQETQTDLPTQRKSIEETNEKPFLGRRRSSVRFEDETPLIKNIEKSTTPPPKTESIPIIKTDPIPIVKKEKEEVRIISPVIENDDLQRNVSFRNNEDDLWTTITINTDRSAPIQSSHYNRLNLENLSYIDTSITNNENGITAIHINCMSIESPSAENVEEEIPASSPPPPPPPPPLPPPQQPCNKTMRQQPTTNRHKPPPPPPSRSHTTSSEDDTVFWHVKPIEEIQTIVTDKKYNYNNLSQALKSNVERLKNTFLLAQEAQSSHDKPMNIHPTSTQNRSSDC